jgi:hypothetical protein
MEKHILQRMVEKYAPHSVNDALRKAEQIREQERGLRRKRQAIYRDLLKPEADVPTSERNGHMVALA